MHNNYYFIRQISARLQEILPTAKLVQCFSQQKEELVLAFLKEDGSLFYIQAHLTSQFSTLYFPQEFNRARRNSIDLFQEVTGQAVKEIEQIENERAFIIHFDQGMSMLFKLYGNRSNIILFKQGQLIRLFKNKLRQDRNIELDSLHKKADHTIDHFIKEQGNFKKVFFTYGKEIEKWLQEKGFESLSKDGQFQMLIELRARLEHPEYYVTRYASGVILALFRMGEVISQHQDPLEAANAFYHAHFRYDHFDQLKDQTINYIKRSIERSEIYITKAYARIDEIEHADKPERTADVIMANLHAIPQGATKVALYDFYKDKEVEIKLKKDLSPQRFAETLYKKAKKRPIEIERHWATINNRTERLQQLQDDLHRCEEAANHRQLEPYLKKYQNTKEDAEDAPIEPFRHHEFMGFKIYIGRNATNNDELTLRFAHKDDLWLHARDVSGSHVIIRHQPGKNFPRPVIEKAASIAAYHSQRRTDSLCPVIYTPKKYVRKVKGAPKGAVRVDKESVIMVVPSET